MLSELIYRIILYGICLQYFFYILLALFIHSKVLIDPRKRFPRAFTHALN